MHAPFKFPFTRIYLNITVRLKHVLLPIPFPGILENNPYSKIKITIFFLTIIASEPSMLLYATALLIQFHFKNSQQ